MFYKITRYLSNSHHRLRLVSRYDYLRLLLSFGAGSVLCLSLAPFGWWIVAFISTAIWYAVLCFGHPTPKQAWWLGWSYGAGLWLFGGFWLFHSIYHFGDTYLGVALLLIVLMALIMGLFNAVQAWLFVKYFPPTPLTFSALWVVIEWLKTWIFTGFPWLLVGYSVTTHPLGAYAPLGGILLVSFVVVFIASSSYELMNKGRWYYSASAAILVVASFGLARIHWTKPVVDVSGHHQQLSVSLIQGNIPQNLKWLTEYREKTMQIYQALSLSEWGRDVVVWPESSIPMFQTEATEVIAAAQQRAVAANSAWVTGIPFVDQNDLSHPEQEYWPFYNSIVALGLDSSGIYKKQRLVPFGEYVPLSGALQWFLPALRKSPDIVSFSAGHSRQAPLMVKGHPLAAAICYEIAYPDITRRNVKGSEFLVTLSNDAWFDHTLGPHQHLQMAQMRARENGRWIMRATNTGITALIDDQGHIRARAPQYQRTVLRGELPAMQGRTPYSWVGDYAVLLFAGLVLLFNVARNYRH